MTTLLQDPESRARAARDAAPRRAPHRGVPQPSSAWPLYALFVAYPIWWAAGLAGVIWPAVAAFVFVRLTRQRRIVVPRGFGIWLLFLLCVLLSATQLTAFDRVMAFLYRASLYVSATLLFVYVYNASRSSLSVRRVVLVLATFWVVVAVGGLLGVLFPRVTFPSLMEFVLPESLLRVRFISALVQPQFAAISRILGFPVGRPQAPFSFTNAWGANFALLTPVLIASWAYVRSRAWRRGTQLLLLLSVVSVVVSLNRGLWVSLSVGLLYAASRFALQGRVRPLLGVVLLMTVFGAVVLLTPLRVIAEERSDAGHSDDARLSMYARAVDLAAGSPVLGYGAPQPQETGDGPSIGTHGQFWLVLVSHGVAGVVCYFGWMLLLLWATGRGSTEFEVWTSTVVLISLVQSAVYEQLPSHLHIVMVMAAVALRDRARDLTAAGTVPAGAGAQPSPRPSPPVEVTAS